MFSRIIDFLKLPNPFEQGVNDHWRVRLINAYLILTLLVFTFFAIFNLVVTGLYVNAMADLVGLLIVIATVIDYRRNHNVGRTSVLVVLNIYLLSLTLIIISSKDYGILLWSIFAPLFSFFLLGQMKGLLATLSYYAILLGFLWFEIGTGVSMHLFVEFVAVSAILVAVIYHYELNRSVAYELIHRASVEDPLTGLLNRRLFSKMFESEYRRAQRSGRSFVFVIMDIDHFKQYNDTNGHDKGDEVLRQVAEVLYNGMRRSGDEVFRLGGEEFGAILNSDDSTDVDRYLENLRQNIEALNIAIDPEGKQIVTASFGVTVTQPDESISPTLIYRKTDQALYRAKKNGRNRVELEYIKPQ